jgi:hypothetical protein
MSHHPYDYDSMIIGKFGKTHFLFLFFFRRTRSNLFRQAANHAPGPRASCHWGRQTRAGLSIRAAEAHDTKKASWSRLQLMADGWWLLARTRSRCIYATLLCPILPLLSGRSCFAIQWNSQAVCPRSRSPRILDQTVWWRQKRWWNATQCVRSLLKAQIRAQCTARCTWNEWNGTRACPDLAPLRLSY